MMISSHPGRADVQMQDCVPYWPHSCQSLRQKVEHVLTPNLYCTLYLGPEKALFEPSTALSLLI